MKLKNIFLISAVMLTSVFATSCNWLDVSPADEISAEEMFKKPEGFYNVLNGIYLKIGEPALYGATMSWKEMEAWGHAYILDKDNHEGMLAIMNRDYEHTKAKGIGETIWSTAYRNIARVNMMIQYAETKSDDFFKHGAIEKKMIIGEALAIRAYLHFDLLRVFAPDMKTGREKVVIPFVSKYPSIVNPPMSSDQVMKLIRQDLEQAAEYVGAYDLQEDLKITALNTNRFSDDSKPEWGKFYSYRGCRLNYWAIRMLQARVALYDEDYVAAQEFAGEFTKLVEDGDFRFMPGSDLYSNPKMMNETLFAFRYTKLIENVQDYFDYTSNLVLVMDDDEYLTGNSDDSRSKMFDKNGIMTIYREERNGALTEYVPALKLSEMYYVMAESLLMQGQRTEAISVFNVFLKARGAELLPEELEADAFLDYMLDDARKEFAGMGQYVFMCKRMNKRIHFSGGLVPEESLGKYVFPLPVSEEVSNK